MKNPKITTSYNILKRSLFSTELQDIFQDIYLNGVEIDEDAATSVLMRQIAIPDVQIDITVNNKDTAKLKRWVETYNGVSLEILSEIEDIIRDLRIVYIELDPNAVPPRRMFNHKGDVNPMYGRIANIYKTLRWYWEFLLNKKPDVEVEESDFYRLILAYAVKNTRVVPFSENAIAAYLLEEGYNYAYRYIQNTNSVYGSYVLYTMDIYCELGSYVNEDLIDNQKYQSRARLLTKEIVDRLIEKIDKNVNLSDENIKRLISAHDQLIKDTLRLCIKYSLSVFPTTRLAKEYKASGNTSMLSSLEIGFVLRQTAFSEFKKHYHAKKSSKKFQRK